MEMIMKNASMNASTGKRRLLRSRLAALTLGVALSLGGVSSVNAIPVYDGANWLQAMLDRISNGIEFGENAKRWSEMLNQVREAIIDVQSIFKSFGLPPGAILTRVPDDYMVTEACGNGGSGDPVDMLFSYFVFNPKGDVKQQQRQICVNIRMMQNRKYNDSVDFIQQTIPQMDDLITKINANRKRDNRAGTVTGVDSDSLRTANELAVQSQSWQARMKAYDAYIEVMEANQKIVAQAALKGDPTAIRLASDLVKTVSLKAALSIK